MNVLLDKLIDITMKQPSRSHQRGGEKEKEEAIQDFEDVLRHVGGWGRFQKTMLAVSFPFTLFLSYVAYSPILINFTPEHWCAPDPQLGRYSVVLS